MIHDNPTYEQLESMYLDQCEATDMWAEKAREQGDTAKNARIAELEKSLAIVNSNLIASRKMDGILFKEHIARIEKLIDSNLSAKAELVSWLKNYGPDIDTSETIDKIDAAIKATKGLS